MAGYAELVGRAESLYGNQYNQDLTGLQTSLASTNQALDTEGTDAATTYAQNLQAYGAQKQQQGDNAAFQASTHGLFGSGIAANMQNKVLSDYQTNVGNLDQLRANKLADIAGRRQLAQSNYNASQQALYGKDEALKAEYINAGGEQQRSIDQQNAMYRAQMAAAYGK